MFKFGVILFKLVTPLSEPIVSEEPILCEDGASPWNEDKGPRWECIRDGCSPMARVCWSDRLTHCYDAAGRDRRVCTLEREACKGVLSCFEMWLTCSGAYKCYQDGEYVGCEQGSCTKAGARGSTSAAGLGDTASSWTFTNNSARNNAAWMKSP